MLIPDQHLGIFVSYNTDTAATLWTRPCSTYWILLSEEQNLTLSQTVSMPAPAALREPFNLARSSYTTMEKVNHLLAEWVQVKPSNDGALLLGSPFAPQKTRLVETQRCTLLKPSMESSCFP